MSASCSRDEFHEDVKDEVVASSVEVATIWWESNSQIQLPSRSGTATRLPGSSGCIPRRSNAWRGWARFPDVGWGGGGISGLRI